MRACSRCRAALRLSCAESSSGSLQEGRALVRACEPYRMSLRERMLDSCKRESRDEPVSPPTREERPSEAVRPPRTERALWLAESPRGGEVSRAVREGRVLERS